MAAFLLYNYNGEGVVTEDEMEHYLTSVFKVMYHAVPNMEERLGVGGAAGGRVSGQVFAGAADEYDIISRAAFN